MFRWTSAENTLPMATFDTKGDPFGKAADVAFDDNDYGLLSTLAGHLTIAVATTKQHTQQLAYIADYLTLNTAYIPQAIAAYQTVLKNSPLNSPQYAQATRGLLKYPHITPEPYKPRAFYVSLPYLIAHHD